jgi:hypothetical protein
MKKMFITILIGVAMFLIITNIDTFIFADKKLPAPAKAPPSPPPPSETPSTSSAPSAPSAPSSPQPSDASTKPPSGTATPSNKTGIGQRSSSPAEARELPLNWQSESLSSALKIASSTDTTKVVFVYFYFNKRKEEFPPNHDTKLQTYSQERFVFTKVFVTTFIEKKDPKKKGQVVIEDKTVAEFFEKHKLAFSCIAVALDPYGNLMNKLTGPYTSTQIIPFLDVAEKKYISIKTDLDKRYEKTEKLSTELEKTPEEKESTRVKIIGEIIKTLLEIVKSPYQGYGVITKSQAKLDAINENVKTEYTKLIKEHASLEKELQDPQDIIPKLEKMTKTYKDLPVSEEIKTVIKDINDGKIPEDIQKELEKEKQALAQDKPKPVSVPPTKNEPEDPKPPAKE